MLTFADGSCAAGDLSMNSKCYRKFHSSLNWYSASKECLSRGGSLAVFTDIGHPSNNSQLTNWLHTDKTYWIGLIRPWWKTTNEGAFRFLCKQCANNLKAVQSYSSRLSA